MTKYTPEETKHLFKLIKENYGVIGDKKTDSNAVSKRNEVWDEIVKKMAKTFTAKTEAQLKQKWKDLQKAAKALLKEKREASTGTGGGPFKEVIIDDLSEQVLLLIGEQIAPIKNLHDSDRIYDHADASSGTILQSDLETAEVKESVCINKEKKKPVLIEAKPIPAPREKKSKFGLADDFLELKLEEHHLRLSQMKEEHQLRMSCIKAEHEARKKCINVNTQPIIQHSQSFLSEFYFL